MRDGKGRLRDDIQPPKVWQPHFLPELLDRLDQDIFEPLGQVTSLVDFTSVDTIDPFSRAHFEDARIVALVLAGERERAAEEIDEIEREAPRPSLLLVLGQATTVFLARDIDSVCAEYHAKEAAAAEALKLGDDLGAVAVSCGTAGVRARGEDQRDDIRHQALGGEARMAVGGCAGTGLARFALRKILWSARAASSCWSR